MTDGKILFRDAPWSNVDPAGIDVAAACAMAPAGGHYEIRVHAGITGTDVSGTVKVLFGSDGSVKCDDNRWSPVTSGGFMTGLSVTGVPAMAEVLDAIRERRVG